MQLGGRLGLKMGDIIKIIRTQSPIIRLIM